MNDSVSEADFASVFRKIMKPIMLFPLDGANASPRPEKQSMYMELLWGKPPGTCFLRSSRRCDDGILVYHRRMGYEDGMWIELAQVCVHRSSFTTSCYQTIISLVSLLKKVSCH
jgi:hypothetical protein